jgi:hypothetical protein
MNKVVKKQLLLLVISLLPVILFPGCKPEPKDDKKIILSAESTPVGRDNLQKKNLIPHKAKFFRKWEE